MVKVRESAEKEREKLKEIRLKKARTFIEGLDEITEGGLPEGRSTLVTGGAGSGKTLMAMEFIYRGIVHANEPGVFMAFEENIGELRQNFASLGMDLEELQRRKMLNIDYVKVERSEIEETGEYNLEGLFVRLNYAIDSIKAKRVVLDTIETLFSAFQDQRLLRAELRRLFRWLNYKGVTSIVTGEKGQNSLTRYGLEEYVADCVILLDNRMYQQVSTRRLRIIKYRGSQHGTNEFPFLISDAGMNILPITSNRLDYKAPKEIIPTGIAGLDIMFSKGGYFRASTVLISGMAGTGKTIFSLSFVRAACLRGEKVLYFSFEESKDQIQRNLASVGINLEPFMEKGLLEFSTIRPSFFGLEMHLAEMHRLINKTDPTVVGIDPVSDLLGIGPIVDVNAMVSRLINFLKVQQKTLLLTNLAKAQERLEQTELNISSLIDTLIVLERKDIGGFGQETVTIMKSRGMRHSLLTVPVEITDQGVIFENTGGGIYARTPQYERGTERGMGAETVRGRANSKVTRGI